MLSVERYERIVNQLSESHVVRVGELSLKLGVTEKTIRGDLEVLEKRGLLKRIHGGAVLPEADDRILPIDERQSGRSETKQAIAKEALKLIRPNDTILMDGGSTTQALASLLGEWKVTVITNDIKIAHTLLNKNEVTLIVLGGERIHQSSSLLSTHAIQMLEKIRVNRLFLSATGVSIEYGLSVINSIYADWKKQIIKAADQVTLLADSTKFNKVALLQFAEMDDIHEIVTDKNLDKDTQLGIEQKNIKLYFAK
ncbi:DeoR/GlpR family DNA-binding transcription regulator [Peribacillus loiseleuriae]|uniref:DeoR/GlpR family DNA-binding transcription regulator n=1 Tax=Peribacillus loiseleuriae TaxID=1679170 RepID=UPI0038130FE8